LLRQCADGKLVRHSENRAGARGLLRPLRIGEIEIPCYVLEDETRVLSQRGLQGGVGMSVGGGQAGEQRLTIFLEGFAQRGLDVKNLVGRIKSPIKFILPGRGHRLAYGYEPTLLADICDVVLPARQTGKLLPNQAHIADQCEILVRGFARVGIIALVDEATGYQRDRTRDALARILEAFIAKELQPWLKTFPTDFYTEMFRLRGLKYPNDSVQRPRYFGLLTNDIVYDRLAPGVLAELKQANPKDESGRRKHKYFQWLTTNVGYPKLREHLGSVVAIMKLSNNWHDFCAKIDRLHPRYASPTQLSFDYEDEGDDDGKGL
jgi:P63C domain